MCVSMQLNTHISLSTESDGMLQQNDSPTVIYHWTQSVLALLYNDCYIARRILVTVLLIYVQYLALTLSFLCVAPLYVCRISLVSLCVVLQE